MDRKSNCARFLFCLIFTALLLSPLFPSLCLAKKVILGWDANPEPDLEGYVVYRNIGSPGPPYKYSDELSEDDLKNPLHPMVTITGLNEHTEYYIAVTAYDTEGNESYFSDQVCVKIIDSFLESCSAKLVSINNTNGSAGGSGSGGGCFINSAAGDSGQGRIMAGIVILLGQVLLITKARKY